MTIDEFYELLIFRDCGGTELPSSGLQVPHQRM